MRFTHRFRFKNNKLVCYSGLVPVAKDNPLLNDMFDTYAYQLAVSPEAFTVNHFIQTFFSAIGVNEHRKAVHVLVRPGFQLRLPFYILLLTMSFVAMALLLGNLYLEQAYISMIENTTQSEYLQQLITDQISAFKVISLMMLFVYAVLVIVITSIYTHRLLGPMIPISRHLKALCDGFYSHRLHLRKKDEMHELANQLNGLAEVLEQRK